MRRPARRPSRRPTQARRAGDPLLLARAAEAIALARSGIGFDFGTEDEGLDQLLIEALAGLPDSEVDQRSRLLGASMANAAADGDLLALTGLSREALSMARDHGHHSLIATAHLASRMSNWNVHLLDQRLEADRQAWEAALQSGSLHLQMNALLYGVTDLTEAGLVHEATEWLELLRERPAARCASRCTTRSSGSWTPPARSCRATTSASAQLADDALVRGLHSHGVNAEQAWAGQAYIRAWDQGQLAGLTEIVEQAAARPPHLAIWQVGQGAVPGGHRPADEARPVLEAMVTADGIRHNPDSLFLAMGALLVEVARALGDSERAAILLRELQPYAGTDDHDRSRPGVARARSIGAIGVAAHVPATSTRPTVT